MPADAYKRARACFDHLRLHVRQQATPLDHQSWLVCMACAGMRARGGESGYVLAVRAIETMRLVEYARDNEIEYRRSYKYLDLPPRGSGDKHKDEGKVRDAQQRRRRKRRKKARQGLLVLSPQPIGESNEGGA